MRWESNELYHYGIKGQKHGVRNYQNEDGTLTSAGRARYGVKTRKEMLQDLDRKRNATAKKVSNQITQAERLEKQSNAAFKNAKQMRKGLGKNVFQRIRAVRDVEKGKGTDEAKAYVKEFDRASRLGDKAYNTKLSAAKDFKSLGKTKRSRAKVMNNNNLSRKLWDDIEKRDKITDKQLDAAFEEDKRNKKRYSELNKLARRGY